MYGARRADAYLANEGLRTETVNAMRDQVVTRFSYQAYMRRFLEAMTDYLATASRQ